ncbi:competence/damage-inducible protein A [Candidatus Paracaedibacter symbiosus]|uniref:competence/damage-inducible protein A n=1 Tax=Candidatus Paracaedibacter symbiosus TaxID=244582 RepID=UPI0005098690|nr:molybdopterin-binding protein [Candidatus Paracaedibacter symbiosus]
MTNPTAAVLIIGNEILSGRTQDTNTQFLCQQLGKVGIDVLEARIIRDDTSKIIETVRALSQAHTYVFTTGGIGATHDDITAACMARAFDKPLIEDPRIVALLSEFYQDQLNKVRLRMALIPEGSTLINNPVSTAPGFQVENVFCLAGIPSVMQAMFGTLVSRLSHGSKIYQQTLTCMIGENTIADDLANIQFKFPEVEIGSYPFFHPSGSFGVNLVLRTRDTTLLSQSIESVKRMIEEHGVTPQLEDYTKNT